MGMQSRWMRWVVVSTALLIPLRGARAQSPEWTLLIRNGTVVDGTGAARYRADVAVRGDRIVAVSRTPLEARRAARVVDAAGMIVAPGFIDLHAHLEPLLQKPAATSAVTQGVTLALGGPDGSGPFPLAAYADSADRLGLGINVAYRVRTVLCPTRYATLIPRPSRSALSA